MFTSLSNLIFRNTNPCNNNCDPKSGSNDINHKGRKKIEPKNDSQINSSPDTPETLSMQKSSLNIQNIVEEETVVPSNDEQVVPSNDEQVEDDFDALGIGLINEALAAVDDKVKELNTTDMAAQIAEITGASPEIADKLKTEALNQNKANASNNNNSNVKAENKVNDFDALDNDLIDEVLTAVDDKVKELNTTDMAAQIAEITGASPEIADKLKNEALNPNKANASNNNNSNVKAETKVDPQIQQKSQQEIMAAKIARIFPDTANAANNIAKDILDIK